jgi:hypothetical protein
MSTIVYLLHNKQDQPMGISWGYHHGLVFLSSRFWRLLAGDSVIKLAINLAISLVKKFSKFRTKGKEMISSEFNRIGQ